MIALDGVAEAVGDWTGVEARIEGVALVVGVLIVISASRDRIEVYAAG